LSLRNHTSDEILRILTKYVGFEMRGQGGSHILLRHKTICRRVTVPKSHKGHPIKLGTLKSIIQQAGITEDDFIKHL
jgi:predicted RNA binding protein YcfA (HicA-like mRNA interferase family)